MKAAALLVAAVLAISVAATASPVSTETARELAGYVEAWSELGDFSGCVEVAWGEAAPASHCVGMADYELGVPNGPETRFMIGSVSKQFTAAAILLLEEDGLLRTEDTVSRHLPEFPRGDEITIHHLLTHTAGLIDTFALPGYEARARSETETGDWVIEIGEQPLEFEPGSRFAYSNSGYLVLAHLVERLSGRRYAEFLRQRIFEPLEMGGSGEADPLVLQPGRARGYDPRGARDLENATSPHPSAGRGAGSLFSTVSDLLRWSQSLRDGHLLSEGSRRKMVTAEKNGYGYGVSVYERFGRRVAGHDGRLPGFIAGVDTFLDEELSVVWAANLQTGIAGRLRRDLAAIALGEDYEMPPEDRTAAAPVEAEALRAYVGSYRFSPTLVVEVKEEDGRLLARAGQSAFSELVPESAASFFNRATWARASFEADPSGRVKAMIWGLGTSEFRGERMGGEESFAQRAGELILRYERLGTFNGTVLVARGDEVLLREGFGMANYELGVPNGPQTKFRVASISKLLTAVAIGRLWETGRLDPATTLGAFLGGYPNGDRITIEHLLRHRSGVPHINDLSWYDRESRFHHELPELIERFRDEPLDFEPGTDRNYSNGGYALLARVIELASGLPYGEFLEREVLGPLQMAGTGHDRHDLLLAERAGGYLPGPLPGRRGPAPYVEPSIKIGGGSLYSTVDDLFRLSRALYRDNIIREATWKALFPPRDGELAMTGRAPGFYAVLRRLLDDDLTVIVLSNNYALHSIDDGLVALAGGREPDFPPVVETKVADAETWKPLLGRYRWPEPFGTLFELRRTGEGHLQYDEVERDTVIGLIPGGGEAFYLPLYDANCTFARGEGNAVTGIECRSWWAREPVAIGRIGGLGDNG